jgi:hypothetical protein
VCASRSKFSVCVYVSTPVPIPRACFPLLAILNVCIYNIPAPLAYFVLHELAALVRVTIMNALINAGVRAHACV